MLLLSVFCVVLSIELGVATPSGNRFKDHHLKKIGNNELNVERNTGEPMNPYNIVNKHRYEKERFFQENQKHLLKHNKKYENIHSNNNPAAFRNVNKQTDVTSESKEFNQNTEERNLNTLNDETSRTSYIASLPQVNRIQNFRPKEGENKEANMQRRVDILSEVNDPKNDIAQSQLNPPIIQEKNPANQEIFTDMKEEDITQFDVPEATPEYTKSLFNEYKHTKENNVKPTITNLPRNDINNKKYQPNSQNANEATFQSPSAEILYETGQAKPFEISNEPLVNSRQGHTSTHNMLSDKQRLKNLYLSSKPTKHYMIVYPDGRIEQVDQLDKIQKVHPNYVMLNAKELLQHSKSNEQISNGSQGSVVKQNLPTTTTTTLKPKLNSIKDARDNQIDNVSQTVNEPPTVSETEITKTNNIAKSSKDEVVTKIITEKNIQNKFQESGTNESEEKTTESPDIEDIVTTARSTMATPTANTEILNQTISNSLSTSNNTDNPNLSKEPANNNSTSGVTLINTKDDSVVPDENTTPTPKKEFNEENEIAKNTPTKSDLNTIKENSNTPDDTATSNVVNDTNISNSTVSNKEERNSTTNLNNGTVITSEDITDSDGNKYHTETIITNYVNESKNNVPSSDDSTLVTNTNQTDTTSSTVNSENNINTLNVTSSNSLTNNTVNQPEKEENNSDTITIQKVSNATNSEVDGTQNSNSTDASSNNSPGKVYDVSSTQEESNSNKTLSPKIVKDGSKDTDDGPDDSDDLPAGNPDALNEKDGNKATDSSNDGTNEDDEDDDSENETRNTNDNLNTESPSSDGNIASESVSWFNATESFWKKLMNASENNSFYFLFPRPQTTKETKKITYPNGTVVIISTETVDNGDGEATPSKTVLTCGNCTTCEKSS